MEVREAPALTESSTYRRLGVFFTVSLKHSPLASILKMADNEDESNNSASAAGAEGDALGGIQSQTDDSTIGGPASGSENQAEACGVTAGGPSGEGDGPPGLPELVLTSSTEDPKDLDGGCQEEVIGHILGTEVLTSYVQASDSVEGAVSTECTTVSSDFLNALAPATTIIYVQPDGSFVESSGLSAEEQQQLIEQLSKQQLVQLTGSEATRIFEQPQTPKSSAPVTPVAPVAPSPSHTVKTATIAPVNVQQVIDHVNKSQVIAQAEASRAHTTVAPKILQRTVTAQPTSYITLEPGSLISGAQLTATIQPQPFTIVQNAAQQLQSAAKQVALQQSQNGAHPIQPKVRWIKSSADQWSSLSRSFLQMLAFPMLLRTHFNRMDAGTTTKRAIHGGAPKPRLIGTGLEYWTRNVVISESPECNSHAHPSWIIDPNAHV